MPNDSLFDFMRDRELTSLIVRQDREADTFSFEAARQWSKDTDWSRYGRADDLVESVEWIDSGSVLEMMSEADLSSYRDQLLDLMRQGRHEKIELLYDAAQDIRFFAGIHSTRQGTPAGGIRRHDLEESELSAISDILNLGRGMSFKDAAAAIPNGGCKLGVHCSMPESSRDDRFYGFLSYCIDRSEAFTGPDMGFSPHDADRIRRFTKNIVGGTSKTASGGATGIAAGWGVFLAMRETLEFTGLSSFDGLRVAVQGVGELGAPLVEHLLEAGAQVMAADIDPAGLEERLVAIEQRTGRRVERVDAEHVLEIECDILSPCAVGAIIDMSTIAELQCAMIIGGANNQLAATSYREESAMATLLAAREIVFIPDWISNAGGVIQGKMEHVQTTQFHIQDALDETERVIPPNVRSILESAAHDDVTPLDAAYAMFESTVYG